MTDPYRVLGVPPTATDEEVKNAYRTLARRYHPDHFVNDPAAAKEAGEKMKEINEAYDAIQREREARKSGKGADYAEIRRKIQSGLFAEAEQMLDGYASGARGAEWHYLKSVVLARRGWMSDALREIEVACMMEPGNPEYQNAREFYRNRGASFGGGYASPRRSYEGRTVNECSTCDMCTNLICLDCCCECAGFDLIRCI